ncbi:MAG TPA: hypothetical protein DCM86_15710 [Verrucomicrobiales bacterium]|nr:hypothetical protein [Verrucomicrobiales bacterium]
MRQEATVRVWRVPRTADPPPPGPPPITLAWILPLLLLGLTFTGCMILPLPLNRRAPETRQNLDPGVTNWMVRGSTTRQEVLLRLGEPDQVLLEDRWFRYHSDRVKWDILWIAGMGAGAVGGDCELRRHLNLIIRFGDSGLVEEIQYLRSVLDDPAENEATGLSRKQLLPSTPPDTPPPEGVEAWIRPE